ncbi:hypothetical protein ACFQ60_47725 [Streptomyces zhihengii]
MVDDVTISVDLRREAKGPRPLDLAEAQADLPCKRLVCARRSHSSYVARTSRGF